MEKPRLDDDNDSQDLEGTGDWKQIWVTDFTIKSAINFHERLLEEHDKNPTKPIVVNIASYGGSVDALFLMLDAMDTVRSLSEQAPRIITVATGCAMSAGAVLLSHGCYRFATPKSRIMLHQIIGGVYGSYASSEGDWKEFNRFNEQFLELLAKNCKIDRETLKQALTHDTYCTPEKALEVGLIDHIGYPKLIEQASYDLAFANAREVKKEKDTKKSRQPKNEQDRRKNTRTAKSKKKK